MTRFIFVRHGESVGNMLSVFYGHTDGELTEKGRAQAKKAADYLKGVHIDIAYSSDLKRAYETGEIIALPHGLVPIKVRELREIFAGEWETKTYAEIAEKYPQSHWCWCNEAQNVRPEGGESARELSLRVSKAIWDIAAENEGKVVLITTHGMALRTLACEWLGLTIEDLQNTELVDNASVSIIDYDSKYHKIVPRVIGESDFDKGFFTKSKYTEAN